MTRTTRSEALIVRGNSMGYDVDGPSPQLGWDGAFERLVRDLRAGHRRGALPRGERPAAAGRAQPAVGESVITFPPPLARAQSQLLPYLKSLCPVPMKVGT